tara:strand:+ start:332 stop:1561 length:1230 start_codon:yes stop_codon:yes gene_type:complete
MLLIKEKIAKIILINIGVFFFIIGFFEIFSYIFLRITKDPTLPFYLKPELALKQWNQEFDPSVGIVHSLNDFREDPNTVNLKYNKMYALKEFHIKKNKLKNILILGGSTTSPASYQYSGFKGTWDDHLFSRKIFNKNKLRVFNAGSGGANSSQELLRMISLSYSKKLDLIITFNGINEIYFANEEKLKDPFNLFASRRILKGLNTGLIKHDSKKYFSFSKGLKPFLFELDQIYSKLNFAKLLIRIRNIKRHEKFLSIEKVDNGFDLDLTSKEKDDLEYAAKVWSKNVSTMRSVALNNGSNFIVFLQPTFSLNMNKSELREEKIRQIKNRKISEFSNVPARTNYKYLLRINYLYTSLREYCTQLKFCYDLSINEDLTKDPSIYTDPRHMNSKGNFLTSTKMEKTVYESIQ